MCGICGMVVPPEARPSKAILQRMNRTLARRGPDADGFFMDDRVGLGHRRLSIIDLEGGQQPLSSADGQVQIIANGEIYNFQALRDELAGQGYRFRSRSDCEVIAHGWDAWRTSLFARLQGMFAIAIWDQRDRKLVLARDRMGQKPLYFGFAKKSFVFGSELKALAAHPDFERVVSPAALAAYLTYECVPEDQAIYAGVSKLLPGTYLTFVDGKIEVAPFWEMKFRASPWSELIEGSSEYEIGAQLKTVIRSATEKRLISDVPLGVFLSGGIDSSTITAAMADLMPGRDIKTFSVSFEERSFDESSHARKIAKHFGTDHHEERLSPRVMIDILPEVADFMCEPLGDGSLIPTYLLSRFTRRTVTVALGGDGGDELFLGYPTFPADRVAGALDRTFGARGMRRLGRAARAAADLLPVSRKNFSFDFKAKRFAQGLGLPQDLRHQAWMGSFMPDQLERVLSANIREAALRRSPYATIGGFRDMTDARDHYDQAMFQYGRLYLTGDVLVKVDRASMARGLEVRAPFLDTDVVELAAAIPGELKLKGMTTKHILKEAVRGWIPDEIIDRPKKGFGMPIGEWIRGPLNDLAHDLLSQPRLRREGFLDPMEVHRLLDEHERGVADHRKPLWTILAFELWLDRYGPGTAQPFDDSDDDSAVAARAVG